MSTISVVIPSYNDEPMLRECLDRLTTQLRRADEIIVVDNASTDDTADVARSFGARVIVQPVRGIFPAASAGYDAASSDIIARLDADSRPPADWLAHIEAELTVAQEVGVLTGPGEFYDGNPLITWLGENLYLGGYFWFGSLWLDNGPIFGSNFAMRREVWRRVRGSVHSGTRRVHDDLDLSLNLPPDVIVQVDDTLRVGISARPFSTWRGFGRRLGWAFLTFRLNWPQASPWRIRDERERYLRERHADDGNATSAV